MFYVTPQKMALDMILISPQGTTLEHRSKNALPEYIESLLHVCDLADQLLKTNPIYRGHPLGAPHSEVRRRATRTMELEDQLKQCIDTVRPWLSSNQRTHHECHNCNGTGRKEGN